MLFCGNSLLDLVELGYCEVTGKLWVQPVKSFTQSPGYVTNLYWISSYLRHYHMKSWCHNCNFAIALFTFLLYQVCLKMHHLPTLFSEFSRERTPPNPSNDGWAHSLPLLARGHSSRTFTPHHFHRSIAATACTRICAASIFYQTLWNCSEHPVPFYTTEETCNSLLHNSISQLLRLLLAPRKPQCSCL